MRVCSRRSNSAEGILVSSCGLQQGRRRFILNSGSTRSKPRHHSVPRAATIEPAHSAGVKILRGGGGILYSTSDSTASVSVHL
jgi:hypothetical protein